MAPRSSLKVAVLWMPGTNCHHETMYAFKLAGATPQLVLISDLLAGRTRLDQWDRIALVGGFSFGDHFGAGRVCAIELRHRLGDQFRAALARQIPMLGICNGFQDLVAVGAFDDDPDQPSVALDVNRSGRFEHRSNVTVCFTDRCLWTESLVGMTITLPVAHAEGRLVLRDNVDAGEANPAQVPWRVVARYGTSDGVSDYPSSPNGGTVAAICDKTGLIMGLMPHPERRVSPLHGHDFGLQIFLSGVRTSD